MRSNLSQNFHLIKFAPKSCIRLMLGVSVSLMMLPASKALAKPHTYTYSLSMSSSYNDCKARATKAANLLLTRFQKPRESNGVFFILGSTAATSVFIQCAKHPVGSSFVVVASTKYYHHRFGGDSLRKRIAGIIRGQIPIK